MIKFKIIRNIAFIGLVLLGTVSCNHADWLETTDKETLTDATMWENEGNADIYLNDCFRDLSAKGNYPDPLDSFTSDNDGGWYYTSYNWRKGIVKASVNSSNHWGGQGGPNFDAHWPNIYTSVRKINTFIAQITANKANYSDEWYNKRIDEARFLRTWFYSELFYRIGGLSIVTEPQDRRTMTEDQIYIPRSTFEQTFNFLVSELTSIINNEYLPVKYNNGNVDAGRPTLGAALALKGFLQLFAASPAYNSADPAVPNEAANKDMQSFATPDPTRWADAAATLKQFIDTYGHKGTKTYDLWPDMPTFWHEANEYNCEVIWDRQHVANTMAQTYDTYGGPVWIHGVYYTWGNYCPTQEIVDEYQMANGESIFLEDGVTVNPASGYDPQNPYVGREQRFYDFIVYDGAEYKQDWMTKPDTIYTRIDLVNPSKNEIDFGSDDVGNTAYYYKKRLDNAHPRGGNLDGRNYVYWRYGQVLLDYAEAQNEAVGPDESVYEAINAIRQRPSTNLPPLPAGLTQDQMRKAIKHERRIELVFENHRL
ncbi:MAG: RagB/SusD family nutrient uptake outer membrane protein, partial [Bacteroidales bacterium]|nr:RagB/SusD family nutrient uptake outer membrane protein [Bacteroidales bacterium]